MYQRLHSLRHGNKSVEEYTGDFYQLIATNELHETVDQRRACYVGELKFSIQGLVNMSDLISIATAHQRAWIIEKQQLRRMSDRNMPILDLLSFARFQEEMQESNMVYALVARSSSRDETIPEPAPPIVKKFSRLFPDELPT